MQDEQLEGFSIIDVEEQDAIDIQEESSIAQPTEETPVAKPGPKRKFVRKNIDTTVDEFTAGSTDKVNSNKSTVKSSSYSDVETEYTKRLLSNYIAEQIQLRGIDIDKAASKQKSGNEDFWKLNMLIRECRNQNKCTTVEFCVELFDGHFDKITSVISLLNEENYFLLKSELKKKFRLDGYKLTSVMQSLIK